MWYAFVNGCQLPMDALEFELQAVVCHPVWVLKDKLQVLCKKYAFLPPEPSLQPVTLLFSAKICLYYE